MPLLLSLLFSILTFSSTEPADNIIGEYWTADKTGRIAIYKCENKYCGRITWRKEPRKDSQNPDPSKKDRNVVGIQFLKDFEYDSGRKVWKDGTVYAIDNGNTYSGKMWLEQNGEVLKMRGFIGFSLLGRTATLTRKH